MSTIKNQLLNNLVGLLTPLSALPIERVKRQETAEKGAVFSVWDSGADINVEQTNSSTTRRCQVYIRGLLKQKGDNDSDAANEIAGSVIVAITGSTLGGLCQELKEPDFQITYPENGKEAIELNTSLQITYETETGNPSALPEYKR